MTVRRGYACSSSRALLIGMLVGCVALAAAAPPPGEVAPPGGPPQWLSATPRDHQPRVPWWVVFGDLRLNELEQQAQGGNWAIDAAVGRLDQARALTRLSRAALWPSLRVDGAATRIRMSANRPNSGTNNGPAASILRSDHTLELAAAYEPDLFGRVRGAVQANRAGEQQAAADLENVRLLLAADVAAGYFNLRALQAEIATLDETLATQSHLLDVVRGRYQDGVANGIDLAQQELIVGNNGSQRQLLQRQLELQRHALSSLVGVRADEIRLSAAPLPGELPPISLPLPGDLLERRPDVAAAERAVASANAQVGVARAAWFPSLTLSGADGWESAELRTLFDAPSAVWSLGLAISQTVFDAGKRRAAQDYAVALQRQATAAYRGAVLTAWWEVEDGLSAARTLAAARADAGSAAAAANQVAAITEDRYQVGLASAIERYTARQNALAAQLEEQQLIGQQWVNTVYLIKALGGAWSDGPRDAPAGGS